ncbi:MAG TPA: dihydrofolate reductase family protein [Acidimicrobiales bacterium]|nr:dihydrofolate reductase family protein [Acidimicrobiales bacterium]
MRTLAVTENITVDGVLDGDFYARAGERAGGTDVDDALRAQREQADTLLLGRKTFEAFRSYWPHQHDNPSGTTQYLNEVRKVVVSTTLDDSDLGWEHSEVVRDLAGVRALKEEVGADIVCTGSVSLVHALTDAGLVDEYRLFQYPVVTNDGRRLFEAAQPADLRLVESTAFGGGVVLLRYASASRTTAGE